MKKRLIARIIGKVQGVLFRDFIQKKAYSLNISGTVENKEDRSIYVIAEGDEIDLQQLIVYLHKGPFHARVMDVGVTWSEDTGEFSDFEILY
jgi:acylphosphatase